MSIQSNFYKSLILEIRPRLQSINVLIALNEPLENVKITLNDTNFEIAANNDVSIISCKKIKIVANSLTSLNITETSISFRFTTVNNIDDWGSFKTELLKTTQASHSRNSDDIFLEKHRIYNIQCKNCCGNLSENLGFNRILPLPSENSEPSDWFCHQHGNNDLSAILNPKLFDVFYGDCYCHLHKNSIINTVETGPIVICKRCLFWLGLKKSADTVKFWFNTVVFKESENSFTSEALSDSFKVVRKVLANVLFNTAKIILSCYSSKNKIDYILIWCLEKKLNVQICDCVNDLNECQVAKVLFKYENNFSQIVKEWNDDTNTTNVDISKPMFVELLKELYKYNKIFPKEFSESNNFYISYFMLYE